MSPVLIAWTVLPSTVLIGHPVVGAEVPFGSTVHNSSNFFAFGIVIKDTSSTKSEVHDLSGHTSLLPLFPQSAEVLGA